MLIAGASVLLFQAYRITEVATIAPFEYIALPFAAVWGFLFWGEAPDATALFGIALIIGSGAFIVVRTERLRAGTAAPATPLVTIDKPSERSG